MNFYAVVCGTSADHDRTIASLKGFDNLTVISHDEVSQIDFLHINSEYVFFIKNGDALSEHAAEILKRNIEHYSADLVYSDESIIFGKSRKKFNFYKPDYSPELILSMNYFRNLLCIRTSLLKNIQQIDGMSYQNFLYELVLKILPLSRIIVHIDEVLYFNYSDKIKIAYQDFYADFDQAAGRKLLENYCRDNHIVASVLDGQYHGTYRIKYAIQGEPLISIVIPFKDKPELLKACIYSILEKSTYKNFKIIE